MVMELAGSRIVAPFFGTSLIVWTSLIGVIMASLCLGNYLGGRLADRRPNRAVLGRILLGAALTIALTGVSSNFLLTFLERARLNIYVSSVVSAILIFALASLLLGMVSPFLTRLALRNIDSSGAVVGRISSLGSAGSILGTFLGGFVLISLFPSGVIFLLLSALAALLSALAYDKLYRKLLALGFCVLLLLAAALAWRYGLPSQPPGIQIDTAYNHISILERNSGKIKVLSTGPDCSQSLMYTDYPEKLVSQYTKYYDLAFYYKPETKRVLCLGGGGYSYPRYLLNQRSDVLIDVVELDPGVTAAAKKYFCLQDNPRLRIFHEDARTFLNRLARENNEQYDAIMVDTFGSWGVIPFQMTTLETAERIKKILKPDGSVLINVIGSVSGPTSGVFNGIYKAFAAVFQDLSFFLVTSPNFPEGWQNIMIAARNETKEFVGRTPTAIAELLRHEYKLPFEPRKDVPIFRDSFAPVERYSLAVYQLKNNFLPLPQQEKRP